MARWSGRLLVCGAMLSSAALLLTAAPEETLAAVPSKQTAPASSPADPGSAGAAGAGPVLGIVSVTHAQNATFWTAVARGKVEAAQALLSACGCPPNAGEVEYALEQLGVKSLSLKLLVKRLGKQAGNDAYAALAASLSKKAATVKKTIPFPSYKAKSATTYAKSPYRVYEIYGVSKGPVKDHWTWKYGITRQMIPAQRPNGQLPACTKYYGPPYLLGGRCTYQWIWSGVGWLQARTIEASYTLLYAITHQGKCPPGMPACI